LMSCSVWKPNGSMVAAMKMACLILSPNKCIAWVTLSPPALCPTRITWQTTIQS
jgi:hypothetical protein